MWLIAVSAAALVGIARGDIGPVAEPRGLIFGALVALLGACLAWRHSTWRWLALSACALALGDLRATIEPASASALEQYVGPVITVGARLVGPPTQSSGGTTVRLLLEAETVGPAGQLPGVPQPVKVGATPVAGDEPTLGQPAPTAVPDARAQRPLADNPSRLGRPPPAANPSKLGQPPPTDIPSTLGQQPAEGNPSTPGQPPHTDHPSTLGQSPATGNPPTVQVAALAGTPSPLGPLAVVADPAMIAELDVGDQLILEGRLRAADSRGPPTMLFPRLLNHFPADARGPIEWLASVREKAAAGIRRYVPEPQASLSTGLLLGGSGQLDADFRGQLQRSGLAHLVAIDGYKQVIVAAVLGGLSVRLLGAHLATLPILLGIAAYTLLTGAHPSAVRAALMVGLAMLAASTGRVADPLTSLLLAALAMAALDPRILLDVGMQLSLSATLGIILVWPRLRRRLRGIPGFIAEPAGLTLAVTLATLPVTLSTFQSVSLVSPVAHILAVPLVPAALATTALLASVSSAPPLANAVAWLAWLPSTLLVELIRILGSLPGAALSTGRLPHQVALGLAAGLLAWGVWGLPEASSLRSWLARLRLGERRFALPGASVCAGLAAIALLELVRPDGRLHMHALSAGRGEAVLIRGPTGRTALVVAGHVDSAMLVSQVADQLAVWEHMLDDVLPLDAPAEAGLGLTLARYPADRRPNADQDERIDLGGGAALDVYTNGQDNQAGPRVTVSFGRVWLPVLGPSPAPSAQTVPSELVSDGTDLWAPSADEQ